MSERALKASQIRRSLARSDPWAWHFVLLSAGIHVAGFAYSERWAGPASAQNRETSGAPSALTMQRSQATASDAIVIELPKATDCTPANEPPQSPSEGASVARIDESPGRGGTPSATSLARNLATLVDSATTSARLQDAPIHDQENRILSSRERATLVNERMAAKPMELTFVASGKGFRYARLRPATPAKQGIRGAHDTALGEPNSTTSDRDLHATLGAHNAAIEGQKSGEGDSLRVSSVGGSVVFARPDVQQGPPSIMANQLGSARDRVDSDQSVGAANNTLTNRSAPGGLAGVGVGGSTGGGAPGFGGIAPGKSASHDPLGDGGDGLQRSTQRAYLQSVRGRIKRLVAGLFPVREELELHQGYLNVVIEIAKNGMVVAIEITRESGYPEFDNRVADAILNAQFEPVPDALSARDPVHFPLEIAGGWRFH
jgi:TonB family protein